MESGLERKFKFTRLKKEIIHPGGIYHIIQRAPGKEIIFLEDKDFLYFIYILKEYSKRYSLDIFSFALLSNHLHILLKINSSNLSSAMQCIFTKYAIYFNNKYQRKGHVFYGTYWASLCLDEKYFIAASLYIHLNPFKAGLTDNPFKYRWSSLNIFLRPSTKSFINCRYILEIIDKDLNFASNVYKRMLDDSKQLSFQTYTGNYKILRASLMKISSKISSFLKRKQNDIDEDFFVLDEDYLKKKIREFKKKGKLRKIEDIKARNYLIEQLKANGYSVKEIASNLGISRQSIYHSLNLTEEPRLNVK